MMSRDLLLFAVTPYLAVALLLVVPLWRCFRSPARFAAVPEGWAETRQLFWGGGAWRLGLGALFLGHLLAFSGAGALTAWDQSPLRLFVLEGAGLAAGALALAGFVLLLRARHRLSRAGKTGNGAPSASGSVWRAAADTLLLTLLGIELGSGIAMALLLRWGSTWSPVALGPYLRSLLLLHPDLSLIRLLQPLVKLHVLAGFLTLAVLPFTHLVYALALPWSALRRATAARMLDAKA